MSGWAPGEDERWRGDVVPRSRTPALPHSRTIHLVTGEFPPQPGGVGDYTDRLSHALAGAGCEVYVWAPAPRGGGAHVHPRAVGGFGRTGLLVLDRFLDDFPAPRTLLVQYAPQAYGMRGMNLGFCRWVLGRRRLGDDVRVMFHEPFHPFVLRRPWRNALAVAHRAMAALLLRAARVAYVSTPAWERLLRPWAPARLGPMPWLPIPATIPLLSVVMSIFAAILTGVAFGMYPALKASRLDPVEALRYE